MIHDAGWRAAPLSDLHLLFFTSYLLPLTPYFYFSTVYVRSTLWLTPVSTSSLKRSVRM